MAGAAAAGAAAESAAASSVMRAAPARKRGILAGWRGAGRVRPVDRIHDTEVSLFAFFSNRLGCMGSLIVSLIGTLLLLLIMGVIRIG